MCFSNYGRLRISDHSSKRLPSVAVSLENGRVQDKILRSGGQKEGVIAGGLIVEAIFPELVEAVAGVNAAQGEDVLSAVFGPEHA